MGSASSAVGIEGFTSQTEVVDGPRLHLWLGGDSGGVPVLLWHGFLGTAQAWRKVGHALAHAGLVVLVPDIRRYGDSDKPAAEFSALDALAGAAPAGRLGTTAGVAAVAAFLARPEAEWINGECSASTAAHRCEAQAPPDRAKDTDPRESLSAGGPCA